MFREMRRTKQQILTPEIQVILDQNTNGILGVHGDDGYPYTVPLSFVYYQGKIYFHCALEGHKIDAIQKNDKVSFSIVDSDHIISEKYTTQYQSVIAFGKAALITNETERLDAFRALVAKYSGSLPLSEREATIQKATSALIVGIQIQHMTGKKSLY